LVMMHELAHAMMFVDDVAYEYENFVKLNSKDNLNNADTYAFFAKGKPQIPFELTRYRSLTSLYSGS